MDSPELVTHKKGDIIYRPNQAALKAGTVSNYAGTATRPAHSSPGSPFHLGPSLALGESLLLAKNHGKHSTLLLSRSRETNSVHLRTHLAQACPSGPATTVLSSLGQAPWPSWPAAQNFTPDTAPVLGGTPSAQWSQVWPPRRPPWAAASPRGFRVGLPIWMAPDLSLHIQAPRRGHTDLPPVRDFSALPVPATPICWWPGRPLPPASRMVGHTRSCSAQYHGLLDDEHHGLHDDLSAQSPSC